MSKNELKKETKLGLDVKKDEDFSAWYTQVYSKLTFRCSQRQKCSSTMMLVAAIFLDP